jgi:NAD-dependent DNA ligase
MGKLEQLQFLEKNGSKVPPYIVVKGSELTDEFLIKYLTERRSKSKYAIDGVVIDIDDADIRRSVTNTRDTLNPAYSRKFKVGSEDNVAYPQVVKVHYKKSKSAYLKPRVEIVPTSLGGVTITFLTGFNAKFIRDNNIGPGAVVKITRSGDVIPYILETTSPAPNGPELPTFEEFGPMNWTDNDVDLYLIDPTNDREVLLNQLGDMFGRMEVPHLKGGSIKKLVNAGFDTGPKIIKATKRQLQDAVGESAGEKIFDGLKNKLNPIDLYTLAGCSQTFGRGIGRRKMKKLIEILGEDDLLLGRLTIAQVIGVESFQQITAQLVVNNQYAFLDFLKEIVGYYTLAKPTALTSSKYIGVNVCFTGVRAKDLEELIVANGGKIASGVNAKTTHLVCKDKNSASGKMVKAHELVRAGTLEIIDLATARKRWG